MKKLRKALVVSVMFAMMLSMSMVVVAPQAKAASGGDLIKMNGLSSVYYLGTDGKRYVFPNETTYFSWYSDFSTVVTVSQSELESYPLGANVTMRPGTNLVKITTDPKVYAVTPGGDLVHVPSETVAKTLWGDNWAKRVVDVPDAFFTNYTVTSNQVSVGAYPAGSVVKWADAADVYYIGTDGMARKINDEAAFTANMFSWDDIVTATIAKPGMGTAVTAFEVALFDPSDGAGGVPGAGTGMTVALASDTPASVNLPVGAPAEFLKFNVTASSDGDVSITGFTFRAYDLGNAEYIDSVTTYMDGVKKGTAKNMTADRVATITYSSPIVIPAGQTKSFVVKAKIGTGGQSNNYAIGLAAATSVTTNGAVVSGSFPIVGKSMAAVTATIGTVAVANAYTTNVQAQFGEDNVKLAGFNLNTANEAIIFESARWRNGGTSNSIVSNVKLFIDSVEVATGEWDGDYINFKLNNYVITKNKNVLVEVYGDVEVGNTSDTVILYVKEASDFVFTGQEYGYGIEMTGITAVDSTADAESVTLTLTTGTFTMDMDKAASPAKEVRPGTDDVVLATFKMTSNAENATVEQIVDNGSETFILTGSGLEANEVTNVEMVDTGTGAIYSITAASSTAGTLNGWKLSMTDEISLVKGVTKTFQIRADLSGTSDSNAIDANDTLKVTIGAGAMTITGDDSNTTLSPTPSTVTGSITTVKSASLTWTTTSLAAKSVVPGASNVVVYRATLKAGNASDVTLNSVRIDALTDGSGVFSNSNVSQLVLKLNGKTLATKSNAISGTASSSYVNFTSLSGENKIPAGQTYTLDLEASFAGTFTAANSFSLAIEEAADSIIVRNSDSETFAETVANEDVASRVVTLASTGTLKTELLTTDAKADVDTYILAGSETTAGRYMGELKFTTTNEPIKVKSLTLEASSTAGFTQMTNDDILAVRLYDKDGVMVAQEGVNSNGDVHFGTLNLIMPADAATSYFIGIVTKSMNAENDPEGTADYLDSTFFHMADSAVLSAYGVAAPVVAEGVNSGSALTLTADAGGGIVADEYPATTVNTKEVFLTGSVLTSIVNDMSDGVLTNGNGRTIGKYKFTFNNGSNRTTANAELKAKLTTLVLNVASSSGVAVSNIQAYLDGNSANKTDAVSVLNGEATIDLTDLDGDTSLVDGTVTLVITANITGVDTSDFVQTEIDDLTADFTYNGNGGTGTDLSNARLDISEVIGATLSN